MRSPADILAADGPLAALIPDYAEREQQIAMAEAIGKAFEDDVSLICEAGTGTGKTFAYLVPAILSGRKVIISTGTRHLQDQLYQRDLELVRRATGRAIHTALLKGRANYLCLHRLEQAEGERGGMSAVIASDLHDVRLWSRQTRSGDLAELTELAEDAPVRKFITSTTDNCLGQECGYYQECHVLRARRQAADADLTVVNHHLLLADLALREQGYGELLPAAEAIIFDEAHQLPDLASQFFSQSLSSHQILDLVRDSRQAYLTEAADMPDFIPALETMDTAVRKLRLALNDPNGRAAWYQYRDRPVVSAALDELEGVCREVLTLLEGFANRGKELDNCGKRTAALVTQLGMFMTPQDDTQIQWLELRGQGFLLHQTPLDIAETFRARLAGFDCPCIYTSATLTVRDSFDHFIARLGLQDARHEAWASPFDYPSQALLYLPDGMPDPRNEHYTARVVEEVIPVLNLTRGRAFVLFTSHRAMQLAAPLLRARVDFPVFVQGEAPRTEILESFRHTPHAVLLGTQSFWEGVDVKGQALTCVIIDKLPFATPDDPVLQARLRHLEQQGGNPFMDYQLPEAVIVLKQGVGRLIRDGGDYGVLMICDPRLRQKSYGRVFLRSLPDMGRTMDLAAVARFLGNHEQGSTGR